MDAADAIPIQFKEKSGSEESCSECFCEACRQTDSAEGSPVELPPTFTRIREAPRNFLSLPADEQGYLPPGGLPLLNVRTSLGQQADSLKEALADLHVKQAQLRARKQRLCAFCKIHGLPVSVKGHKAFCQFRQSCTCTGCVLIRCTQKVSKSQVRLRRLKDLEIERGGGSASSPEQSVSVTDNGPSKKTLPMCFKCWVHDSVRVRLKGHRALCPYARCACSNCALNSDRKWLTRQLRQLTAPPKREESEGPGPPLGFLSSTHQHPDFHAATMPASVHHPSATMSLGSAATVPSGSFTDSSNLQDMFPLRLHKPDDWRTGIPAWSGIRQHMAGGTPSNPPQTRTVCQETDFMFADTPWLPGHSSSQATAPPLPPLTALSAAQGHRSASTVTPSSYNTGAGVMASADKAGQGGGSLLRWFPQHPAPYGTGDLLAMPGTTVDYPQHPAFSLASSYFQYPVQAQSQIKP